MTRCIFWNVDHFSEKRFYNASSDTDHEAGKPWANSSAERTALLYRVIEAATPDIIVIVETSATLNKSSDIAKSINAPFALLKWLREAAPSTVISPEWRLVPPLIIAGQPSNAGLETVAVFYRGVTGTTQRFFTGPNIWPGGANARSTVPGVGKPRGQYGGDINTLLVPVTSPATPARTIPVGALHNAALAEDTVAARTTLHVMDTGVLKDLDFGKARPPFMVSFTEVNNTILRNLTLFAVHSPGDTSAAEKYIDTLSTAVEVNTALDPTETRIIGGDFNLNLFDENGKPTKAFEPLTKSHSYRQLLVPTAPAPTDAAPLEAWKGYFWTHIAKANSKKITDVGRQASRFLWSDGATVSPYPSYNYQSAQTYSLDNILIWPFDNARNYQTTIMNTVISSPLSSVMPVPAGASAGTIPIASEIAPIPPLGWPQAPNAADYDDANATLLLAWQRYGHIVSTSDHFALFTDV